MTLDTLRNGNRKVWRRIGSVTQMLIVRRLQAHLVSVSLKRVRTPLQYMRMHY